MSEEAHSNDVIAGVVKRLRKISFYRNIASYIMIFLTIAATALTIFAFLQSPIAGRRANDIEANFEFFGQKAEIKSQSIFDDRKEQPPSHEELLFSSISGSLVRLSAVLFAAFLIQHMAAFARYNMQIATFMEFSANVLEKTKGDPKSTRDLAEGMGMYSVSFGKIPEYGQNKILEALGAITQAIKK